MKIVCVSNEDTIILFQLLGIEGINMDTEDTDEFQKRFDQILSDKDVGVIIINEKYLLRNKTYFKPLKTRKIPLIVEIPDMFGPLSEEYFENFIKQYIGLTTI